MKTSWLRGFLTVAAVVFFGAAFLFMMGQDIPDANRDAIMILIGALIARSEKIDSFFFGSSQSSHQKDELLAGMAGNPEPAPQSAVDAAKQVASAADAEAAAIADDTLDLTGAEADRA